MSAIAKIFKNGQSQAIRLPKEFRFENQDEVYVEKIGHSLLITPKEKSVWDLMRYALDELEAFDFQRNQPPIQERDLF